MRKLTTLVLAAACGLCAMAQTTITNVELSLDKSAIDFYVGNTEGNVQQKIRANATCPTNDAYSIQNKSLTTKQDIDVFWGIGYGDASISTEKTYAASFWIQPKSGYTFPSDFSTISFKFNNETITPDFVELHIGGSMIMVYILLGEPAAAPATTYTLAVVNAAKYGYSYQDFIGGDYLEGAEVIFQAKEFSGKTFDKWVAEGLTLTAEQEKAWQLTITMPANNVTITATYTDNTPTAVERTAIESLRTEAGRVVCSKDFKIFTVTGIDVTHQNGNLEGIYIVKTATYTQKVVVTR